MTRYNEYDRMIHNEKDIQKYKNMFERELEDKRKELSEFIERAEKRVIWLNECEENKQYCIIGGLHKKGKNKDILLIIRYPDGTQRDERYSYPKISDLRNKLVELKYKYTGVDWSNFDEEIS